MNFVTGELVKATVDITKISGRIVCLGKEYSIEGFTEMGNAYIIGDNGSEYEIKKSVEHLFERVSKDQLIKTGMEVKVLDASAIKRTETDPQLENGKIYKVADEKYDILGGIAINVGPSIFYISSHDLKYVQQVWKSPIDNEYYPVETKVEPGELPEISLIKRFSPIKPEYYHQGGIDVFTYGEANFSKEAVAGFYRMNIIKYVSRYDRKDGIQDLEKAEEYLSKLRELVGDSDDK